MTDVYGSGVFKKMGVRPFINCSGNGTKLGGSRYTPQVMQAVAEANDSFVIMSELLDKSGEYVAGLMGTEAAYITSGCFAALALSSAACMAGRDPDMITRIPDTTGMRNEIVIQKKQRYSYDRAFTAAGARLVEAGHEEGCTLEQLETAIGPSTAAIAYLVRDKSDSALVSLEDAVNVAHAHNLPVIGDAVKQIYPPDYFRRIAQSTDLMCFSGKYFGAPTSTGFVCGDKDLIRAVSDHGYIGFYNPGSSAFGRGFKVGRQEIIAIVVALEEWLTMDHEDRLAENAARVSALGRELRGIPNVRETKAVESHTYTGASLHVVLDSEGLGKSAQQVVSELNAGDPRILMGAAGDDTLNITVRNLKDGEDAIVARSLRSVLKG